MNYEGIDLLLRELERLNSKPLVVMTHTLKEAYEYSSAPARYARAYGVMQRYQETGFTSAFEKKYHTEPYGYAGPGYDAVQFLVRALKAGVVPGSSEAAFTYQGVTGLHRYPAPSQALVQTTAEVMRMHAGRLTPAMPARREREMMVHSA